MTVRLYWFVKAVEYRWYALNYKCIDKLTQIKLWFDWKYLKQFQFYSEKSADS